MLCEPFSNVVSCAINVEIFDINVLSATVAYCCLAKSRVSILRKRLIYGLHYSELAGLMLSCKHKLIPKRPCL